MSKIEANLDGDLATIIQNSKIRLVPYSDELFEQHMRIRSELYPDMTSLLTKLDSAAQTYRHLLAEESSELKMLVFDTESDELVGEVMAQPQKDRIIELGWDVLPDFQRRGYATAAVTLLMQTLARREDCRGSSAVIAANNTASKALARKLGGLPSETRLPPVAKALGEEGRAKYVREHRYLLTEEVAAEAAVFGVSPEELLTHSLVFAIPHENG